jgi:hypothetical protein
MSLNSNGVCDGCQGAVRNAPGHRLTIDRLTTLHNTTCPGRPTKRDNP